MRQKKIAISRQTMSITFNVPWLFAIHITHTTTTTKKLLHDEQKVQ